MRITINGERREIANPPTIHALLESLDLAPGASVVERNGEIVDRGRFGETVVAEGDVYEIVRIVGGG